MSKDATLPIRYRRRTVDGIDLFYREAGDARAPALVLLHGFPTSSHMFRDLMPLLADRFHLVAPDYPGFGYSAMPPPAAFTYTFDNLADVIDNLLVALGLQRYALYIQDYGAPIGLRIAARHPERVTALVVQNGNAYEAGLSPLMQDLLKGGEGLKNVVERAATEQQYYTGVNARDRDLVNPDAIEHAQWGMDRPGNKAIQLALLASYGANLPRYPEWHAYFRQHKPPALIAWGKGDPFFTVAGAEAYKRDLPQAELHLLDAGHFALETHAPAIAGLIRDFLGRVAKR